MSITQELTLPNGQRIKNRLAKGAMTEGLADAAGEPTASLNRLYERWAEGGTGLLLTGNIQVDPYHLERSGNVIINGGASPEMAVKLAAFAKAGQANGTRVWGQVSHAGRQTAKNINPAPQAPSAVKIEGPAASQMGDPVAMSAADIAATADAFVAAARALKDAGFDGVQLHAAHGYLLSQFLSPKSNRREDQWGGSLENRARLLLDITRRVAEFTDADFGLSVKLNSADFMRGAFDIDDSVQVARWLDEIGVDLLEVSGGSYEAPRMAGIDDDEAKEDAKGAQQSTREREAYFLEFAPRIGKALNRAKLMVTGGFRTVAAMNDAIASDGVDLIGIARPLCVDPAVSAKLLSGELDTAPRYEQMVRLGPGPFSPQSRFKFFKNINVGLAQFWFCQNLLAIAQDEPPLGKKKLIGAVMAYRKRDAALAEDVRAHFGMD